jgi:hypothetical protein
LNLSALEVPAELFVDGSPDGTPPHRLTYVDHFERRAPRRLAGMKII